MFQIPPSCRKIYRMRACIHTRVNAQAYRRALMYVCTYTNIYNLTAKMFES